MGWQLPVHVDRSAEGSLADQLRNQIKQSIIDGILHPGVRLPSTRQMAVDLDVSRSVVVEAYEQLVAEGYLDTSERSATRVACPLPWITPLPGVPAADPPARPARHDLRPGTGDLLSFPVRRWKASLSTVLGRAGVEDLSCPPVAGVPVLRDVLAGHLGRTRRCVAARSQLIVTAGFAQGLAVCCRTFRAADLVPLAIEDPGHPGQRDYLRKLGMPILTVPVDDEGLDVDALHRSGARSVLVTPAHQFPTGVALSHRRREELVRWAYEVDGYIVEDDYDGEFWHQPDERHDALQALAPDRVVYGGSASKALFPGLRLGWLLVPPPLSDAAFNARETFDLGTSSIDQLAFAEFAEAGELDRHLRHMRQSYRDRRLTLEDAFAASAPEAVVAGPAAGIHALVRLPADVDEWSVVHAASARSVRVLGLSSCVFTRPDPGPALVIGYGSSSGDALAAAVGLVGEALRAVRPPAPGR